MRFHNLNNLCAAGRLLALSAVVLFFSCNRMEHPDAGGDNRFSLSVVSDAFSTKGAEYSETVLTQDAKLYITATMRDPQGRISSPSVFLSGSNPAFAQLEQESGTTCTWVVKDQTVILPLGGYKLRALAFGADRDNGDIPTGFGTSCWVPTLNAADAASGMRFDNVDTYANQVDLLYGATGDITGSSPTGTLVLQHALAQLIFNVKFTGSETAFITTNGSDFKFQINDILFVNNAGLVQYLNAQTVTAANILLKTLGTFTIDNTKTVLKSAWSSLAAQDGQCKLPMGVTRRSDANPSADQNVYLSNTGGTATPGWRQNLMQGKVYQLGDPLLVPEQPVCDFIVVYTYDGVRYSSRVLLPEGTWKSGRKYIYNLEIARVGGFISFTAAGQGIGGEYDTGNVDRDWM